jgi:hypothetical protein
MQKPKMTRQEKIKEREETKAAFAEKLAEMQKEQNRMDFELDSLKRKGQLETSAASSRWVVANNYNVYLELETIYGILGDLVDTLYDSNSKISKISAEWQKKKKILTMYRQALDFTDETLSTNK